MVAWSNCWILRQSPLRWRSGIKLRRRSQRGRPWTQMQQALERARADRRPPQIEAVAPVPPSPTRRRTWSSAAVHAASFYDSGFLGERVTWVQIVQSSTPHKARALSSFQVRVQRGHPWKQKKLFGIILSTSNKKMGKTGRRRNFWHGRWLEEDQAGQCNDGRSL